MPRGKESRSKRRAKRQGVSVYAAKALRSGINPCAHVINGAVNIAMSGLRKDKEGWLHCTRRRQRTIRSISKQLYNRAYARSLARA